MTEEIRIKKEDVLKRLEHINGLLKIDKRFPSNPRDIAEILIPEAFEEEKTEPKESELEGILTRLWNHNIFPGEAQQQIIACMKHDPEIRQYYIQRAKEKVDGMGNGQLTYKFDAKKRLEEI